MFWGSGKAGHFRLVFVASAVAVAAGAVGCASPKGVLFEPIDPPKVWPPAPDVPRIKLVGALSSSRDLKAAQSGLESFKATWRGPRAPIEFSGPHAVALRSPNLLAVADGAGAAVHLIDLEARTHRLVTGWDDQRFAVPLGVAWAGDRLFVTDAQRHEVIELDAVGGQRSRFGADVLKRPVGIAFVPQREQLYVVDGGSHSLAVFDLAGNHIRDLGQPGAGAGEFNFPTHIACAGDQLLVADSGNFRVQLLDLDGRCLRSIGKKGDGAGNFALPKGVAFDSAGHWYVVDAQFENVQVFDSTGQLLMAFGEEGRELGKFWLPAGIAIDQADRIWVADAGNRRVQVFAFIGAAL
ncbi:MAG: hypothetical protein KJ749_10290 [Planctomycetes bacterium]|nr:hypothetical protein [Planctomycetota bacterium]